MMSILSGGQWLAVSPFSALPKVYARTNSFNTGLWSILGLLPYIALLPIRLIFIQSVRVTTREEMGSQWKRSAGGD